MAASTSKNVIYAALDARQAMLNKAEAAEPGV